MSNDWWAWLDLYTGTRCNNINSSGAVCRPWKTVFFSQTLPDGILSKKRVCAAQWACCVAITICQRRSSVYSPGRPGHLYNVREEGDGGRVYTWHCGIIKARICVLALITTRPQHLFPQAGLCFVYRGEGEIRWRVISPHPNMYPPHFHFTL